MFRASSAHLQEDTVVHMQHMVLSQFLVASRYTAWVLTQAVYRQATKRVTVPYAACGTVVPSTEPCALRSIQPLKVSIRDFSWGKGGRCVWLTTYHPCSAETSRKSGVLTYPEPLGPPRPVAGDFYFTFYYSEIGKAWAQQGSFLAVCPMWAPTCSKAIRFI